MPHGGTGFFYYAYTYSGPWKKVDGLTGASSTGTTEVFKTAIYTKVNKESHQGQNEWFKRRATEAIEEDVNRWLASVEGNKQGLIYERFNPCYIQVDSFRYCDKLPLTKEGRNKGKPYGREI